MLNSTAVDLQSAVSCQSVSSIVSIKMTLPAISKVSSWHPGIRWTKIALSIRALSLLRHHSKSDQGDRAELTHGRITFSSIAFRRGRQFFHVGSDIVNIALRCYSESPRATAWLKCWHIGTRLASSQQCRKVAGRSALRSAASLKRQRIRVFGLWMT